MTSPRLRPEGHAPAPYLRRIGGLVPFARTSRASRSARERFHSPGRRRVVVRAREVQTCQSTRAHVGYLRREGVEADGTAGRAYGPNQALDTDAFVTRASCDATQARIMLSPEDASELGDLRAFTRTFMDDLSNQLDRPLDWMAFDHFNTGHPHTHVVLRETDGRGESFRLGVPTLTHGLRERACDLLTLELGPDDHRDLRERLRAEAHQQQWTGLDIGLVERARKGLVDMRFRPRSPMERLARSRSIDRLRTVSRMGLAREDAPLVWRLSPELPETLRRMSERTRKYRLLDRYLHRAGIERAPGDRAVFDPDDGRRVLCGRVLGGGTGNGAGQRPHVAVDATDGRAYYVELQAWPAGLGEGMVVGIEAAHPGLRALDAGLGEKGIGEIRNPPEPDRDRLQTLARWGLARRDGDGTWTVSPDLKDRIRKTALQRLYGQAQGVVFRNVPRGRNLELDRWLAKHHQAVQLLDRGFGRSFLDVRRISPRLSR